MEWRDGHYGLSAFSRTPGMGCDDLGCSEPPLHIVNGDVFRWKWMWPRLADYFGLEPVAFNGEEMPLTEQMAGAEPVWAQLAKKHGLIEPDLDKVASFWHTDGDLLRPFECVIDMAKSRKLGFDRFQASDESFLDLFQRLKAERVVPSR